MSEKAPSCDSALPLRPVSSIAIGLNAAIIAVRDLAPVILEVPFHEKSGDNKAAGALPFGPFDPDRHPTLEAGLRAWVKKQTSLKLGYVEQLYTFGDRGRRAKADPSTPHEVSIGYLALTRPVKMDDRFQPEKEEQIGGLTGSPDQLGGRWRSWYRYFPWEDWRNGRPPMLDEEILPRLEDWIGQHQRNKRAPGQTPSLSPRERLKLSFGLDGLVWDEERVLERYELLYEAGLVLEHFRDRETPLPGTDKPLFGHAMQMDHRRILATAISRLRGKLKYRPVVFELMPPEFTLTQLQASVEAISGRLLHKQNFRRLVEQGQLVEPTGAHSTATGGRPAALFRFRRSVLAERPSPGLKLGGSG